MTGSISQTRDIAVNKIEKKILQLWILHHTVKRQRQQRKQVNI